MVSQVVEMYFFLWMQSHAIYGNFFQRMLRHFKVMKRCFVSAFFREEQLIPNLIRNDVVLSLYSTRLHLPPVRFLYVGGCWDWTQDSARSHPLTEKKPKTSLFNSFWRLNVHSLLRIRAWRREELWLPVLQTLCSVAAPPIQERWALYFSPYSTSIQWRRSGMIWIFLYPDLIFSWFRIRILFQILHVFFLL
jgi:hypothetical protein